MRHLLVLRLGVIGVLSLGACSDSPRRGGAGESCTSADDCRDNLACISQVCRAADGGVAGAQPEGGSCGARRDCAVGLSCISSTCQVPSDGTNMSSSRYSGKGETCTAKNDCEPDLSCVMGVCRSVELSLTRAAKSCYRVECASQEDCCQNFTPNVNCPTYEMNCAMDPIFCNTYRSLCLCGQDCVDEQCVAAAPGCQTNAECTSTQTPFCVEGKCRQCDSDAACAGTGAKCAEGVCMAACSLDENCPLLHACQDGVCTETGCTSDRECAFLTGNQLAVCRERECQVPCNDDSECNGMSPTSGVGVTTTPTPTQGFEICEEGMCVFVGCESNAECRALLGLENERGNVQAVCR